MGYKDYNKPRKSIFSQTAGWYTPKNPEKYKNPDKRIAYRSKMELKFCQICDMNPRITEWTSETLAIPYRNPVKNKICNYYIDYCIKIYTIKGEIKKYMVEVKSLGMLQPPSPISQFASKVAKRNYMMKKATYATNMAKKSAAIKYAEKYGYQYIFLTETFFQSVK